MHIKNKEALIFGLLGFVTIIWGLNVIMVKYLSGIFPVIQMSAWRITIATVFLLLFTYKHWSKSVKAISIRSWILLFFIGFSSIFLHQIFLAKGLNLTSGSVGSLILGLNPLMTALFAMFLLGDKFELKRFIGIGLGFFGVILIVGQPSHSGVSSLVGDAIVFLSMLAYVAGGLLIKKAVEEVNVLTVTTISHVFGAILLLGTWMIQPSSETVIPVEGFPYAVMIFSGCIATALCTTLWNMAIQVIGPSRTTLFLNIMPLSSLFFAAIFLNEKIIWLHGIALLFIMVGIYLGISRPKTQLQVDYIKASEPIIKN